MGLQRSIIFPTFRIIIIYEIITFTDINENKGKKACDYRINKRFIFENSLPHKFITYTTNIHLVRYIIFISNHFSIFCIFNEIHRNIN